jgi:hypothetical protein
MIIKDSQNTLALCHCRIGSRFRHTSLYRPKRRRHRI